MKLRFDTPNRSQPDPFIFEDGGRFYMYVTAGKGVEAYSCDSLLGEWKFEGIVMTIDGCRDFWAPCIIKAGEYYHIYVSCSTDEMFEHLHTARSKSPLGPFAEPKKLYDRFSIDAHVVDTKEGLFLWFAQDNTDTDRVGTRVWVDRLLDPYTPANEPKEVIVPTFDEEIFMRNRFNDGKDWHTIEGAFWFKEDGWQYVMYSGACYENDTYHIGYSAAKSDEEDLTKVDFKKHTENGKFAPTMIKNEFEEGVGHHSVIKIDGQYYAIYHGRDIRNEADSEYVERRTARICKLKVKDGIITAERYENKL